MHTPLELTFAELIRVDDSHNADPLYGCSVTLVELVYNPSAVAKVGTFKKAHFGVLYNFTDGKSTPKRVCLKKCIRRSPPTTAIGPSRHEVIVYDSRKQAELLTTELNCLSWALA
jgi:hypothetical protein